MRDIPWTLIQNRFLILLFFLFFSLPFLAADETNPSLPRIHSLNARDMIFAQYLSDVELSRRYIFNSRDSRNTMENIVQALTIYIYHPVPNDNLIAISARCNIPYSSIATLNRISNAGDFTPDTPLLLPSMPGIFIHENPESELELLLSSSRTEENTILITVSNGSEKTNYIFLPGADFYPTERIFFLNRGFNFPLRDFRITSAFGLRRNPVTGNHINHQGIDLAAPENTPVYPVRDGIVSELGNDPVLGLYIIVSHNNNWVSIYGHLSLINAALNQRVNSGNIIGRVGSTGQSTGPHLHFELRHNGVSRDPERLLRLFQGN